MTGYTCLIMVLNRAAWRLQIEVWQNMLIHNNLTQ